jgi:hypothetical protein
MNWKKRIPRFTFYLERIKYPNIFWISKEHWSKIKNKSGEPIEISIKEFEISSLAETPDFRGAYVRAKCIEIFRYDKKDNPYVCNKYVFNVIEDISTIININRIAEEASTSLNTNLTDFLQNHVLIYQSEDIDDHWSKVFPHYVKIKLDEEL